jgi:hypothetical protein
VYRRARLRQQSALSDFLTHPDLTGHRLQHVEANSMVITTRRGSEYLLGKPDQKQIFAQQRLIRRLSRLGQTSTPGFNELATEVTDFRISRRRKP